MMFRCSVLPSFYFLSVYSVILFILHLFFTLLTYFSLILPTHHCFVISDIWKQNSWIHGMVNPLVSHNIHVWFCTWDSFCSREVSAAVPLKKTHVPAYIHQSNEPCFLQTMFRSESRGAPSEHPFLRSHKKNDTCSRPDIPCEIR